MRFPDRPFMQEGIHWAWFFLIGLLLCNTITFSLVIVLLVRQQRYQENQVGYQHALHRRLARMPRRLARRVGKKLVQDLPPALQHQLARTQEARQAAHTFCRHYRQYRTQLEAVIFLSKYSDPASYQQALNTLAAHKRTLRDSYRTLQGVAADAVTREQGAAVHECCHVLFDDVTLYAHGYLSLLRGFAHRNFSIDHHTGWDEAQKEQQRALVAHERIAQTQEYTQQPTQRLLRDEMTGHLARFREQDRIFAERIGFDPQGT